MTCLNGHEVQGSESFCPSCGIPLSRSADHQTPEERITGSSPSPTTSSPDAQRSIVPPLQDPTRLAEQPTASSNRGVVTRLRVWWASLDAFARVVLLAAAGFVVVAVAVSAGSGMSGPDDRGGTDTDPASVAYDDGFDFGRTHGYGSCSGGPYYSDPALGAKWYSGCVAGSN